MRRDTELEAERERHRATQQEVTRLRANIEICLSDAAEAARVGQTRQNRLYRALSVARSQFIAECARNTRRLVLAGRRHGLDVRRLEILQEQVQLVSDDRDQVRTKRDLVRAERDQVRTERDQTRTEITAQRRVNALLQQEQDRLTQRIEAHGFALYTNTESSEEEPDVQAVVPGDTSVAVPSTEPVSDVQAMVPYDVSVTAPSTEPTSDVETVVHGDIIVAVPSTESAPDVQAMVPADVSVAATSIEPEPDVQSVVLGDVSVKARPIQPASDVQVVVSGDVSGIGPTTESHHAQIPDPETRSLGDIPVHARRSVAEVLQIFLCVFIGRVRNLHSTR
ncbi:hypothetical protein R1sor_009193 [Riccia sorocarpa]|uniref:Uncharacterized protein n=1 Tax=Riccia sorocarpa TaxID=122646 RepID=A0ABD3H8Z6_9MARC